MEVTELVMSGDKLHDKTEASQVQDPCYLLIGH